MFDGEDGMDREEKEEAGGMHRRAGVEAQLPLSSETTDQRYGRVDLDAQGIAFPEAGVWRRIATVFAGPFFNFILAFVVAVVLTAFSGVDLPVIGQVSEDSAAEEAGLQPGDRITQINHEKIHFYREITVLSSGPSSRTRWSGSGWRSPARSRTMSSTSNCWRCGCSCCFRRNILTCSRSGINSGRGKRTVWMHMRCWNWLDAGAVCWFRAARSIQNGRQSLFWTSSGAGRWAV